MSEGISPEEQMKATKTTCKEAARMIQNGQATKVHFRPDGPWQGPYSDEDPALVWLKP